MSRAVATCLMIVAMTISAEAFTKKEIADAAYHWGRVDYAAEHCARLGANKRTRKEVQAALSSSDEKAWGSGYELGQSEAEEFVAGSGEDAFCQLAWVFYGRNGQTMKNLLVRR